MRLTSPKSLGFGPVDGPVDGLLAGRGVDPGGMIDPAHDFGFGRHKGVVDDPAVIIHRDECVDHRQVVFPRKVQIPLIMGRTSKDRPGAVVHQYKVGDPDGQRLVRIKRMLHRHAGVEPLLFRLFHCGLGRVHPPCIRVEGGKPGIVHLKRF